MNWLPIVLSFSAAVSMLLTEQDKVNPGAQTLQDFSKRVADYVKIHEAARARTSDPKPSNSPEVVKHHEHSLSREIGEMRGEVAQGNIFTPEIAKEFRRLLAITMQSPDAKHIRESLRHAEPLRNHPLRVNGEYPDGLPLQSIPPSLLLNLPPLPKEVEYRIVGNDLILRDVGANLIVDFIENAIVP
ncbi:MAG TPA: hypothetical protein VKU19_15260 [Bryobacteraceae bacterium]|nr:hypothetical protein [Bryobacteraceae bacterium]